MLIYTHFSLQVLNERSDITEVPSIDVEIKPPKETPRKPSVSDIHSSLQPDQHISVIVKNDIDVDREKLRRELEKEKDIYERVRQELQKEIQVKETVNIQGDIRETIIIKEESPDYEEITIDDDFEKERSRYDDRRMSEDSRNYDLNHESDSSDESEMRKYDMVRSESSDRDIFECKIGKLVTQSVNHIYNDKKKVFAKTVFIANDRLSSNIKTMVLTEGYQDGGVLNLSMKEGRRKSHGRKQSAPRRLAYYNECDGMYCTF